MSEKSSLKKKHIVDTARRVFIEKGYAAVTMKDIVESCGISRGGLYIYYDGIKPLFEDVIHQELSGINNDLSDRLSEVVTRMDILKIYIREQKRDILFANESLAVAIYEYAFANKIAGTKSITDNQFRKNAAFLERLFIEGNENGEFDVVEPKAVARNMAYAFEGLKVLSRTGNVSEKMIDDEIAYLVSDIIPLN